jgi:hypothetical protein
MNTKKPSAAGAKKPAPKAPKKAKAPVVKETIQHTYRFTPEEISAMDGEIRIQLREIDELEAAKKQANSDFKLRIDSHDNTVRRLRAKCDSGEETRSLEAIVQFHKPKQGRKTFIHPQTGEKIRDEEMSLADTQLPMFKPAPDGKGEVVAPKGATDVPQKADAKKPAKPAKAPKASAAPGKTNVGDAIDKAAALTDAPKLNLDLATPCPHDQLTRWFRKAAKDAEWNPAQVSVMIDRLRECDTVEKMKDTLRPHCLTPDQDPTII